MSLLSHSSRQRSQDSTCINPYIAKVRYWFLIQNIREVKNYADYTIHSEIWSIGALVYDILLAKFQPGFDTGLNGFFPDHFQQINLEVVPYCFRDFLQAAMDETPANRPDTLTELIQVLHQCLDARGKQMYKVIE